MKDIETAAAAAGTTLQAYLSDLVEALDDVVKGTSSVAVGDKFDFRVGSQLSTALGLSGGSYASSTTTEFGKQALTRPEGTMSFAGAMLQAKEAVVPQPPVNPPLQPGELPESVIAGKRVITSKEIDASGSSWGRNASEVEAVRMVVGTSKEQLHQLLTRQIGGRSVAARAQKPRDSIAFSVGHPKVGYEFMDWSSDASALRTKHPRNSITVEPERIEVDANTGEREVTLGRDQFVDHVMEEVDLETGEFTGRMLATNHVARVRERCGADDGTVTRLLFQMKIGAEFDDEFGVKEAEKGDERRDGLPVPADTVKKGVANFIDGKGIDGSDGCIATKKIFVSMKERVGLPKVQNHGETLRMDVVAHKRAPRGRYHMNETSPEALRAHFKMGSLTKLKEIVSLLTASAMPAAQKDALLKEGNALLDRSAVVAEVADALKAIDPNMTVDLATITALWPEQQPTRDKVEVDKREVVASALNKLTTAFADKIDDLQRAIGGSEDREVRRAGGLSELKAFFAAQTGNAFGADALKGVTTAGPMLAAFDRELAGANRQAFIDGLAAHMSAANEPNTRLRDAVDSAAKDKVLGDIRKNIVTAHVEFLQRMLKESGANALALANDSRRLAYTGTTRSGGANMYIDSRDVTEGYGLEAFATLTDLQRSSRSVLPDVSKMNMLLFSSDFQIELDYEKPFKNALRNAKQALLAPIFLEFAMQKQGSGTDLANRATFSDYIKKMAPVPNDNDTPELVRARDAFVADLAAFVKTKLPDLNITLDEVIGLVRDADGVALDSFSNAIEFGKLAPAELATRRKDLAACKDIYRGIIQMLDGLADHFGISVLNQLNRAARELNMAVNLTWEAPKMSKDQMVSAIAQGRQV
jgi:hypothetical protein